MKASTLFLAFLGVAISANLYSPVRAQEENLGEAYYIVKEGDSLWSIATRFRLNVGDLQQANNLSDPGQVALGARLIIPGLPGIASPVDTVSVGYGETLRSLSRQYHLSESTLARMNRFVTPNELYAGASLIVRVIEDQNPASVKRADLTAGQSLLELALVQWSDPWSLTLDNQLSGTWGGLPNDTLRAGTSAQEDLWTGLPVTISGVEIDPTLMVQGGTVVIKVNAPAGITLRGALANRALNFFPQEYGYVALQGIHAMTPAGRYPLALEGELFDGKRFAFSQNVLIQDAAFPYDPSLEVDPATIDPAVTEPEKKLWESLGQPVTLEKMWSGPFSSPVPLDFLNCWTSLFGNRRSYNGGAYDSFHSGLDFCGRVGTELYAVALGKVIYTDMLIVRGGVVVIDHGWGVYTAYDHLSEILVQVGDTVQAGQLIGLGGATGRTTGPHLHWEVWVGGVQVNPVDWLTRSYP